MAQHRSGSRITAVYLAVLRHHYVLIGSLRSKLSDPCVLSAATGPTKVLKAPVDSQTEPDPLRVRQPFAVWTRQELGSPADRGSQISTFYH